MGRPPFEVCAELENFSDVQPHFAFMIAPF